MKLRALLALLALLVPTLAPGTAAREAEPRPWAEFVVTPGTGTSATPFRLDLAGSFLPAGTTILVDWGDGASTPGTTAADGRPDWGGSPGWTSPPHAYTREGSYRIEVLLTTPSADAPHVSRAVAWAIVVREPTIHATGANEADLAAAMPPPNDVVDVLQRYGTGARVVSIVNGLDPLTIPPSALLAAYETCDAEGCEANPILAAEDPEGVSSAAFHVLLQKALTAEHHVLAVADAAGQVEPAAVVSALARAEALAPDVVVLLFSPDGFDARASGDARPHHASWQAAPRDDWALPALWSAAIQNTVGLDFGREAPHDPHHHTGTCPSRHSAGPGPGQRSVPAYPSVRRFEPAIKPIGDLVEADFAHLDPSEAEILRRETGATQLRFCLAETMRTLAAAVDVVVVPAGDAARHGDTRAPTWDVQSLWSLASVPDVLTVGATTSVPDDDLGHPTYGSRRVILPTSGAGPTRAQDGIKPDLVAPADVPATIAADRGVPPLEAHFADDFVLDRGWQPPGRVHDGVLNTGGTYTRDLGLTAAASFEIIVNHAIPASSQQAVPTVRFAFSDDPLTTDGWGFEAAVEFLRAPDALDPGAARVTLTPFDRDPALCVECVIPPFVSDGSFRVSAIYKPATGKHEWRVVATKGSTVLSNAAFVVDGCACHHLVLDGAVSFDDLVVRRWPGTARPVLDDWTTHELPPLPEGYATRALPSTRISAAYVAGVAAVHAPTTTAPGALRSLMLHMTRPLADVPPAVQGAGELRADWSVGLPMILGPDAPKRIVPSVPYLDWGRVSAPGLAHGLVFRMIGGTIEPSERVDADPGAARWWRLAADGSLEAIQTSGAPTFTYENVVLPGGASPTRAVTVALQTLPTPHHTWIGRLPFVAREADGDPLPGVLPTDVTLVVTRGAALSLAAHDAGLGEGEAVWLFAAPDTAGLVFEPEPDAPVAYATVDAAGQAVGSTLVAPADYAVLHAQAASLPIPIEGGALPVREGGRPRDLHVLTEALRIEAGNEALPAASARGRVAYHFLDVLDAAELEAATIDPAATVRQAFESPVPFDPPVWDLRGEPHPAGHARDDPLPLGETVLGWEQRLVELLPGLGLGPQTATSIRSEVAERLASTRAPRYALEGALDTRPFLAEADTALPWARLAASVPLPSPADDAHGTLALPLELREAVAWVRIAHAHHAETYLVTPDAALVPASPEGLTWPHEESRVDALPDSTAGGRLSGYGHEHPRTRVADGALVARPATGAGFLLPFSFHDADPGEPLRVEIVIVPAPPAASALGALPGEPVPGPRYRVSPLAVAAWTSGVAARGPSTLGVFVPPPAESYAAGSSFLTQPFEESSPRAPEDYELFVRGPDASPVIVGADGTRVHVGPDSLARAGSIQDGHSLFHGWSRPGLGPGPLSEALRFAEADGRVWRIPRASLEAAGPAPLTIEFVGEPAGAATPAVREPFPDAPDANADGLPRNGVCVGFEPHPVSLSALRGCPAGLAAGIAARASLAAAGFDPDDFASAARIAVLQDQASGRAWLAPATPDLSRAASLVATSEQTLLAVNVPSTGALLALRHALVPIEGGSPRGEIRAEAAGTGISIPIATIEGTSKILPGALRSERLDVFDLAPYAGRSVTIRATPTDATWHLHARLLPSAPPAPEAPRQAPASWTAGPVTAPLVPLPEGLDVAVDRVFDGGTLLLGSSMEPGLVRVRTGATLTLRDLTLRSASPEASWGIHVEPGGALVVERSRLLDGGLGPTRGAAILAEGSVALEAAELVGGSTGIRVVDEGAVSVAGGTIARFTRAAELEGGRLTLVDALVAENGQGLLARDAIVEIEDGLFAANAAGAIAAQDSLVAVDGTRFFGNGGPAGRAALVALEGLDTGRVVVHGASFLGNAEAVRARAPVELHEVAIAQRPGPALVVGPAASLRVDHGSTTSDGVAIHAGAGSALVVEGGTLDGSPYLQCALSAPPARVEIRSVAITGPPGSRACGDVVTDPPAPAQSPDWRAVVARPFVPAGANPALTLPRGLTTHAYDATAQTDLGPVAGALILGGADRSFLLAGSPGGGPPAAGAPRFATLVDSTPPTPALALPASVGEWTRDLAIPVTFGSEDSGSGIAFHDVLLSSRDAEGRTGLQGFRALSGARGDTAVLGTGAARGGASLETGERASLRPVAYDRAGNHATGSVARSVSLDATPPALWAHVSHPCGKLLGHDFEWRAHDPRAGSGLPATGTTYTLHARVLTLDELLGGLGLDGVDWARLADPRSSEEEAAAESQRIATGLRNDVSSQVSALLEQRDHQAGLASVMRQAAANADLLEDLLPLLPERLIGEYPKEVERFRFSFVDDLLEFIAANPAVEDAAATWDRKVALDHDIENLAALALARAHEHAAATHSGGDAPLDPALLATQLERLEQGLHELAPLVVAYRLRAVDAVGNSVTRTFPAIADAHGPQPILGHNGYAGTVAAALLTAGAHVDLDDLHAELHFFDPECGLVEVIVDDLEEGAPNHTLYPRHGFASVTPAILADLMPPTACGPRELMLVARDRAGHSTQTRVSTHLDRMPPLSTILSHRREAGSTPAGFLLDADAKAAFPPAPPDPQWNAGERIVVETRTESRNLGACASAALHTVEVEARIDAEPWSTLWRAHVGSQDVLETESTIEIRGETLARKDDIDGRLVEIRVRGDDESGNVEEQGDRLFVYVDRVAPECSLTPFESSTGFVIPVEHETRDPNLGTPGVVSRAALVMRARTGPDLSWHLVGPLDVSAPQSTPRLDRTRLPAGIDPFGPINPVTYACIVYDAAGNAAMGAPFDANLDLDAPEVTFPGLPAIHSNGGFVLPWVVTLGSAPLAEVTIDAGRVGEPLVRQTTSTELTGAFPLVVDVAAEDGVEWEILVEAHTTSNTVGSNVHKVRFDAHAPALVLPTPAAELLPHDLLSLTVQVLDPGLAPSPVDAWVIARGSGGAEMRLDVAGGVLPLPLADGTYDLVPHACDLAGNCMTTAQSDAGTIRIRVDRTAPTTLLGEVQDALDVDDPAVLWIDAETAFRFGVDDPGSGAQDLAVDLQRLDLAGSPIGLPVALPVLREGELFVASVPSGLLAGLDGVPFELWVAAKDHAGNVEPRHRAGFLGPLARFAHDASPPVATLDPIAPYLALVTLPAQGVVTDARPGKLSTGLASFEATLVVDGVETVVASGIVVGGQALPAFDVDLAALEGEAPTLCLRATDRGGARGACASATFLVDRTAPVVTVEPPIDAGVTDPITRFTPARIRVTVANAVSAEGHLAAPIERVHVEVEGLAKRVPGIVVVPIPEADRPGPGASATVDVALALDEGPQVAVHVEAPDAAGNGRVVGSDLATASERATTEVLYRNHDTETSTGRFGKAKSFATNGESQKAVLTRGQEVTGMAWIRVDVPPSGACTRRFLGYEDRIGGSGHQLWRLEIDPLGQVRAYVHVGETTTTHLTLFGPNVGDAIWRHVAFVAGGGTARLYVDGTLVDSKPFTGTFDPPPDRNFHFPRGHSNTQCPTLSLDEIRVFGKALAPEAITELMLRPYRAPDAPAPLALRVDTTVPRSVPTRPAGPALGAYQVADSLNIDATDEGQNPTGVADVVAEGRTLDVASYALDDVARHEPPPTFAQGERPNHAYAVDWDLATPGDLRGWIHVEGSPPAIRSGPAGTRGSLGITWSENGHPSLPRAVMETSRTGRTFGAAPVDAERVQFQIGAGPSEPGITQAYGLELRFDGGQGILLSQGTVTHGGGASHDPSLCTINIGTGTIHERDLVADKARCAGHTQLTGPITSLHLHHRRDGTLLPGSSASGQIWLADVRLMKGSHTLVKLPWIFPFYGEPHDRLYVSENGVIGFEPGFNEAPPTQLDDRKVIAPAWGDFAEHGLVGARPHGVAATVTAAEALVEWQVTKPGTPGERYQFSASLRRSGEIVFGYHEMPDATLVKHVGVSNGNAAQTLAVAKPAALHHAPAIALVPSALSWSAVGAVAGSTVSQLPLDRLLEVRSRATDVAGNVEPAVLAGRPEETWTHRFDASNEGFVANDVEYDAWEGGRLLLRASETGGRNLTKELRTPAGEDEEGANFTFDPNESWSASAVFRILNASDWKQADVLNVTDASTPASAAAYAKVAWERDGAAQGPRFRLAYKDASGVSRWVHVGTTTTASVGVDLEARVAFDATTHLLTMSVRTLAGATLATHSHQLGTAKLDHFNFSALRLGAWQLDASNDPIAAIDDVTITRAAQPDRPAGPELVVYVDRTGPVLALPTFVREATRLLLTTHAYDAGAGLGAASPQLRYRIDGGPVETRTLKSGVAVAQDPIDARLDQHVWIELSAIDAFDQTSVRAYVALPNALTLQDA